MLCSISGSKTERPEVLLVDAGYWHNVQMKAIEDRGSRFKLRLTAICEGKRPGWNRGFYQQMRDKLTSDHGRKLYAQRKITIEPVLGQIKHNRGVDRFVRKGRAAARSEWRLLTAIHNLLKLDSHSIANPA